LEDKPRSRFGVKAGLTAQSFHTHGFSAGHPGFRRSPKVFAKAFGPRLGTPFQPPAHG
jgi:hypothetical protein